MPNFIVDPEHIEELEDGLKKILNAELTKGNRVVETYYGWTIPGTLFVFLEKPFKGKYRIISKEIEYCELNDPHYWKAEYRDKKNNQILACGF